MTVRCLRPLSHLSGLHTRRLQPRTTYRPLSHIKASASIFSIEGLRRKAQTLSQWCSVRAGTTISTLTEHCKGAPRIETQSKSHQNRIHFQPKKYIILFSYLHLPQRPFAAALAISARFSGDKDLARARPPLRPNRAASDSGPRFSSISPVAIRPTMTAAPITSAGRFSPLGPLGMGSTIGRQLPLGNDRQGRLKFKLRHYRTRGARAHILFSPCRL